MKPSEVDRSVTSSGDLATYGFGFSKTGMRYIIRMLRDQIYSNKPLAVLREYGSNAWDAHRSAGKADLPIKVVMPTQLETSLIIRDYGPGMSEQQVGERFVMYGDSSKRDTNDEMGAFGIGAKSGFAYNDTFNVTSWHDGMKKVYVAMIDKSDIGVLTKLHEEECDPEETGIEIKVPVRPADIQKFHQLARELFVHFRPQPDINIDLPPIDRLPVEDIGYMLGTNQRTGYANSSWMAIIGCVGYRININSMDDVLDGDILRFVRGRKGALYMDIGSVDIVGSREDLEYTDKTKLALALKFEEMARCLSESVKKRFVDLKGWALRFAVRDFSNKYSIPLPEKYRRFTDHSVRLYPRSAKSTYDPKSGTYKKIVKSEPPDTFTLNKLERSRGGALTPVEETSIAIDSRTVIVLRDTTKSLRHLEFVKANGERFAGKSLAAWEVYPKVVRPHADADGSVATKEADWDEIEKELNKLLEEKHLQGVPIVRTSEMLYNKPARAKPKPAHRMRCFRHRRRDKTQSYKRGGSNEWEPWIPEEGEAKDLPYLVLDRFQPKSGLLLYVKDVGHRLDEIDRAMQALGVKPMPDVVGHKTTPSKPFKHTDESGKPFEEWLLSAFDGVINTPGDGLDLLTAFEGIEYLNRLFGRSTADGHMTPYLDRPGLSLYLGDDHPLTKLAEKIDKYRAVWKKATKDSFNVRHQVSTFCKYKSDLIESLWVKKADQEKARRARQTELVKAIFEVHKMYPLFHPDNRGPGIGVLNERKGMTSDKDPREHWFDYIKMVDEDNNKTKSKTTKEGAE